MNDSSASLPQFLITRERTSKLELLIHLLTNLQQALLLCGPEGIGKTTLLTFLQDFKGKNWEYCYIAGHENLSFENVLKYLHRTLFGNKAEFSQAELTAILAQCQSQQKKIILLIDDAGLLVPGLMATILQYAEEHSAMRVVFTLTHDEFFVLSRADRELELCHFIELPPLSELQCGEFLRQLAARPKATINLSAITDAVIENIYRETRGIPGRIVAKLPVLAKPKSNIVVKSLLMLALIALIVVGVAWLRNERQQIEQLFLSIMNAAKVSPQLSTTNDAVILAPRVADRSSSDSAPSIATIETLEPDVPEFTPGELTSNFSGAEPEPQLYSSAEPIEVMGGADSDQDHPAAEEPLSNQQPASPDSSKQDSAEWLKAQPAGYSTLQIAITPKLDAVLALKSRHPDLSLEIRYAKQVKLGKERYFVFYGIFASTELAKNQLSTLPKELKQAAPIKISSLVNDLQ